MKPGDKFLVMFEVKRLAEPNETVNGITLRPNSRQNLWVAEAERASFCNFIICSDLWDDKVPPIPPGLEGANFKT